MGPCAGGLGLTPPSREVRDGNGEVRARVSRFLVLVGSYVRGFGLDGALLWFVLFPKYVFSWYLSDFTCFSLFL